MIKKRKGLSSYNTYGTDMYMGTVTTYNLKLYDTIILRKCSDEIQLNSGGWRTHHTKKCINENLPPGYRVFQKNFDWYVDTPKKKSIPFTDHMILKVINQ